MSTVVQQSSRMWKKRKISEKESNSSDHEFDVRASQRVTSGTTCPKERSSQENANASQQKQCSSDSGTVEMEKPQSKFNPKIDNSTLPFKPSLRSKPNAIQPLEIYEEWDADRMKYSYCHPYMHELNAFKVPSHQLETAVPIPPVNIDDDNNFDGLTIVDDHKKLALMMADLETVREIAIDSEHNFLRSFYGFLSVLQISTRTRDYIIDGIALRSELEVMNKFFTDPNVLKVIHAASSDVVWLQKDLNLYLVNMFDTSIAAIELGCQPQPSLATLLKQYCDINIRKKKDFQKHQDWRERPFTCEALLYARNDTHYLLYLYDILRNELIAKSNTITDSLLLKVYERSTDLCKKMYRKPPSKLPKLLQKFPDDYRRRHATKLLYEWRDNICREMDESTSYLLCDTVLLQLVEKLPETIEEMEEIFRPSKIGSVVQTHLSQLLKFIAEARKQPIVSSNLTQLNSMKVTITSSKSTQTIVRMRSQSTQTESYS